MIKAFPAEAVLDERGDTLVELGELGVGVGRIDEGDAGFVGKIDAGFDEGQKVGEGFDGLDDPMVEGTGAEVAGGFELAVGGGGDGGGDAFGLSEIEFAVEKGLGGEFAGAGLSPPMRK